MKTKNDILKKQVGLIGGFKVHTTNLLTETFKNACRPKDYAALQIPLSVFIRYLVKITERCSELNDPVLNKIMCDMSLYAIADPQDKENYDIDKVNEVSKKYFEYIKQNTKHI